MKDFPPDALYYQHMDTEERVIYNLQLQEGYYLIIKDNPVIMAKSSNIKFSFE